MVHVSSCSCTYSNKAREKCYSPAMLKLILNSLALLDMNKVIWLAFSFRSNERLIKNELYKPEFVVPCATDYHQEHFASNLNG